MPPFTSVASSGLVDHPSAHVIVMFPSGPMDHVAHVLLKPLVVDFSPNQHPTYGVGDPTKGIPLSPPCVGVPNDSIVWIVVW